MAKWAEKTFVFRAASDKGMRNRYVRVEGERYYTTDGFKRVSVPIPSMPPCLFQKVIELSA